MAEETRLSRQSELNSQTQNVTVCEALLSSLAVCTLLNNL